MATKKYLILVLAVTLVLSAFLDPAFARKLWPRQNRCWAGPRQTRRWTWPPYSCRRQALNKSRALPWLHTQCQRRCHEKLCYRYLYTPNHPAHNPNSTVAFTLLFRHKIPPPSNLWHQSKYRLIERLLPPNPNRSPSRRQRLLTSTTRQALTSKVTLNRQPL